VGISAGSLVEQELYTLPEQLSSSSVCSEVSVVQSLVFCVISRRSLFVLLSFFLLTIIRTNNAMTNVTKIQTRNSINITHGKLKTEQALCSDKT
jgi:hypothetical protein